MKKNILIIDDDESFVYLIERKLKKISGIGDVFHFYNGKEGLDFFQNENPHQCKICPDIILLDLNMPILNGFDFLHQMEALLDSHTSESVCPTPEVYILSSSSLEEDKNRAKKYNMVKQFYTKPLDIENIFHLMDGFTAQIS